MKNAIEYYRKLFDYRSLDKEQQQAFADEHKLNDANYRTVEQIYKNTQFKKMFGSRPDYNTLTSLSAKERNTLLEDAAVDKTIGEVYNKENTPEEALTKINQLTFEGKKALIESGYDPNDKYYGVNPLKTIAAGTAMGAAAGAAFGGVGAIPGAVAGAAFGLNAAFGYSLADAFVANRYNKATDNILDNIVAKDNDRKKEISQEIAPQVTSILENITSGNVFKDNSLLQQSAPVLGVLKEYGVDVSKGDASNVDTLFNKVVAKNNSYYDAFKDRHELSNFTEGDKMKMIVNTLATDLTFNDGGYSSMSINNQDIQNTISKNQSALDWGFNTGKNVALGTIAFLGQTASGIAALGAYAYDKTNQVFGKDSHLTQDVLEGKLTDSIGIPLIDLSYWDGVDKFNTFDRDIIKKARENGGISPYNNVSLSGEEGRFFSWESLNEALKMTKYAAGTRATDLLLGQVRKLASYTAGKGALALGMDTRKALGVRDAVDRYGAVGSLMATSTPVSAGYGLGAYEETKQNLTEKEDKRQAKELLSNYMKGEEFNKKVAERAKELMKPITKEGQNVNAITKENAEAEAKRQVGREMASYFTDYVKNNRDALAATNKDFKDKRDAISRIAVDSYALDATIEGAKNSFVNINFKNYLYTKSTNQLLKGNQSGIKVAEDAGHSPLKGYNTFQANKADFTPSFLKGENTVFNNKTGQFEYKASPKKAGLISAGKSVFYGGFVSNYTDDLTTGAVEGAANQRYDNYLNQKYNGDAIARTGQFLGNLYSTTNAFIQGGVDMMSQELPFYDGFIGALGMLVPGSGRLKAFGKNPYESTKSREERSTKSKVVEGIASLTGVGNAYYNAKYQDIANAQYVEDFNKILNNRSFDLLDILDLASATNVAELSLENDDLHTAKTAKDRAFLSTLLFLSREKENPLVQACPTIQTALKAIQAIREGTLGTAKADAETQALYENMKQEFLKETSNKEEAKLPPEQAETAADERLQHNIANAKEMLSSMDNTMAQIQMEHPDISRDALEYTTSLKVMADSYNKRLSSMEKTLGLSEGSTTAHKLDVNDILALYQDKGALDNAVRENEYTINELNKKIKAVEEDKSIKKALREATITALKEQIDDLSIRIELMKEAGKTFNEEGKNTKVFTLQEIENMEAGARARLFGSKENLSPEQRSIINEAEQKYSSKGISNVAEYMRDMSLLKDNVEANMKAYKDAFSKPEIAEALVENKQKAFKEAAIKAQTELRTDVLEKELLRQSSSWESQNDFNQMLPTMYQYDRKTLDRLVERHKDNTALSEAVRRVKEAQDFRDKAFLPLIMEDPSVRQSVNTIIENALKSGNTVEEEFDKVFNSKDVNATTKEALKRVYNRAKGIKETEKSTVQETSKEKTERQETQKEEAKKEQQKIQEAEKKAEETKRKETPVEKPEIKETPTEKPVETPIERKEEPESPTLEEQVEEAKATPENEVTVHEVKPDVTDQGNRVTETSDESMTGNTMYGYDNTSLVEEGKEVKRAGANPNDSMSRFFRWLDTAGVKLQEIIDNELSSILKAVKKVEFLYINPVNNATDDAALDNYVMLCVEYTDAVKKVHNEERGGVVTANGKQYLIIGTAGYNRSNPAQKASFTNVISTGKRHRREYFNSNTSERFYVDPTMHTEVEQMTSGRIVREMQGDEGTEVRPVTELLKDPKRNPKGLRLEDLIWGIQMGRSFATIRVTSNHTVYPPRDATSNLGAAFLLIEAANGNYIPVAIAPTKLTDIAEGALKKHLYTLFNELTSEDYTTRNKAISQLVQLLVLNKKGDNILIGKEGTSTISITRGGTILKSFNIKSPDFNRTEFINAIEELNPRINLTLKSLKDPSVLRMYAEAGALNTDVAKLGTSNASYTVYAIDGNGKPIKTTPVKHTPSDEHSDLKKSDYKKKHTVYYKGVQYREKDGKWYDNNWKEVGEPTLLNQIKWAGYIRANDLTPSLTSDDRYGNKDVKYYIIDPNPSIPKVIKVLKDGTVAELNIEESRGVLKYIKQKELKKAQEEAAKKELESEGKQGEIVLTNEEEVDLGLEEGESTLTDEQLLDQSNGNFTSEAKPSVTDSEVKARETVDRIVTDAHGITLNEEKGVYEDSNGSEYARVTSTIQATEGAERFDPKSPWILPSTRIGIGADDFVRDFFAGKLGNLESLAERYPNATNEQLQAFEKQLREFKKKLDAMGLTVVPRDITVTGEVEVIGSDGKKYRLPVAGTLDLLAYDKDGNFYIFDMKTNRSAPNEKKAAKWNKQLSLYKKFLEEKYGVKVVRTSIIPIEVGYPSPEHTNYSAKGNQLYVEKEGKREPFTVNKLSLHNNIPIATTPVEVKYNLLTDTERALLKPVTTGTYDSSVGVRRKEPVNRNTETNNTRETTASALQEHDTKASTDVKSILKKKEYRSRIAEILKKKGFRGEASVRGKASEIEAWLQQHRMPLTNITDVESWINMLEECR